MSFFFAKTVINCFPLKNNSRWIILDSVRLNQKRCHLFLVYLKWNRTFHKKKHENCTVTQPTADFQTSIAGSQMAGYVMQSLSLPAHTLGHPLHHPSPPFPVMDPMEYAKGASWPRMAIRISVFFSWGKVAMGTCNACPWQNLAKDGKCPVDIFHGDVQANIDAYCW